MTGRQWRHFCVEWPHVVVGLFGPKVSPQARSLLARSSPVSTAPTHDSTPSSTPVLPNDGLDSSSMAGDTMGAAEELGDGWCATTTTEEDRMEITALERPPDGPDMRHGSPYYTIFGDIPLEDAVLTMFCQAALVNGMLFGDNQYSVAVMPDSMAVSIADAAHMLGRMVQVILGPVHTTKLHRLMYHLLQELRNRGNLSEGDTSENESMHARCKQMFRRSNKRGATLPLQMLRAEETQDYILGEYENEGRAAKRATREAEAPDAGGPVASYRGVRVTLSSICAWPGLSALPTCLGIDVTDIEKTSVTVGNTTTIVGRFDWGTPSQPVRQYVRGAEDFHGSPWRSHVLYEDIYGARRWGVVRVLLRAVNANKRQAAVIQCLKEVPARPGCVLTRYGCQRLAWDFASTSDEWPRLAIVEVPSILRVEQVHTDWWDLARRHGIHTMPSTAPDTEQERRSSKFFTNVFYPWVSRSLNLDS